MTRRLRNRLDKLESPQSDALTANEQLMLSSILGRRDALFWPWRSTIGDKTPHCEIRSRQRDYLAGTVGIAAKADGKHQWKDSHGIRQRLITSGMITATHSSGQVQSCFLTPLGEAYARALVGDRLHTMETGRMILAYLRIKSEQTPVKAVRESVLLNIDGVGDPESWQDSTEMVLPVLTAGLATCHSDTQGRACYTPVDGIAEPPIIAVDVESDDEFDECYLAAFHSERQVLTTAEPRDSAEIFIPLPATGWGWPVHFPKEIEQ